MRARSFGNHHRLPAFRRRQTPTANRTKSHTGSRRRPVCYTEQEEKPVGASWSWCRSSERAIVRELRAWQAIMSSRNKKTPCPASGQTLLLVLLTTRIGLANGWIYKRASCVHERSPRDEGMYWSSYGIGRVGRSPRVT